jgi:hypothetical protein
MSDNKLVKVKSVEEIRRSVSKSGTGFDAWYIFQQADKEMKGFKGPKEIDSDTAYYKAVTLCEFDKGILLLNSVPNLYQVFTLDFSKNLQTEYGCATPSEKSLAEIVALNFVRTLEVQRRLKNVISDVGTKEDVRYLAVLSKELDRAQRHYLTSLQALKMLKAPLLAVNIKTQTAVVGQNQIVQTNNQNDNAT